MTLFGVPMDGNVRAWDNDQRRVASILVLVAASVLLAAGLVVFLLAGVDADLAYWILVALLVAFLVLEIVTFLLSAGAAHAAGATPTPHHEGAPEPHLGPAGPSAAAAPAARQARLVTLRCGDCGTEFEITDTGERPLHHVCPGCGLEGVLRAEGEADAGAVPPPQAYAPPPPEPPAAEAPPPAPPVKKLKLRCGGCREVFSIEDTGERPLRRPCPFCGRTGEVR